MIDIKKKDGTLRYSVEISDQCVYHKELGSEEYVTLVFTSDTRIPFAKGDYIETEFGTFKILKVATPSMDNEGGYKYEQRFESPWADWENRIMFYDRQHGFEKSWKMTQRPEYFLDILVSNLRNAGFGNYTFEVDASLTEMKLIEFDGTSILDALTKIAEAWETEWWITDNVIHLCKCEYGEAVSLTLHDAVTSMEPSDGKDTSNYATRLYAFGSTRNLRKNYRKDENNDAAIEGVVETRLKLPEGTPYVDAWENMSPEDIVEAVAIFDDVYPHRVGSISSITTKEYTDTIENEDGTETKEKWNAYRFTDAGITFKEEYVIPGEELRITFQSGKLAGMDFAVKFNPDGLNEEDANAQVYEIVRNEDYGIALPSDDFKPAVDDTYVLYGYDTTFVADHLESLAEAELLEKAIEKVAETSKDKLVHTCETNPIRCAGYTEKNGVLEYDPADVIDLDIGQRVKFRSIADVDMGERVSRVRSFEKSLANKFVCTYTIGDAPIYSKREELNEKVETLTYQTKEFTNAYGAPLYAIKNYDNTTPSDHNVYSAKRADRQFARKDRPDTFQGVMTFKEGAMFGDFLQSLYSGVGAGIDKQGNAEFESVRVRSFLECLELIINRLSAVEGDMVLTEGDTVEHVEDLGNNRYILYLKRKWDGYFTAQVANNVLKGMVNTLAEGSGRYYTSWLRVESVNTSENYIEVLMYPDADTPSGKNYPPVELMNITRWGNQVDTNRQSSIYLSSTEGRIMRLTGVTAPKLTAANYGTTLGTLPEFLEAMNLPTIEGQDYLYARGLIVQDIIRLDYQGNPEATIVDRGEWKAGETYYCNAYNETTKTYETSDVWHLGCRFRCAQTATSTEPMWGNTNWAMVEGNPNPVVELSHDTIFSDGKVLVATLTAKVKAYNRDITDTVAPNRMLWQRYSQDASGHQRTKLDSVWNNNHRNIGNTLQLTFADLDYVSTTEPAVVKFAIGVGITSPVPTAECEVKFVPKGDKGDKGDKGETGANGKDGADGSTLYTWIKYSDIAKPTASSHIYDTPKDTTEYIGIAVNKTTKTPSTEPSNYTWSRFKGGQGVPGADGADGKDGKDGKDGVTYYTWVKYADDKDGNGISDSPEGKAYIGFAYNKTTATESNTPTDYKWSLIKGEKGEQGIQGKAGADGKDGKDGANGKDGKAGDFMEYRYAVGSLRRGPGYIATDREPAGWDLTEPSASTGQYVWRIQAKINGDTNELLTNWGSPTRITPYDGVDGAKGDAGEKGADAERYWIETSVSAISVSADNVVSPESITIKGYRQVGSNTPVKLEPYYFQCWHDDKRIPNQEDDVHPTLFYDTIPQNFVIKLVYQGGEITKTIPYIRDGAKGLKGDAGEAYWIDTSVSAIRVTANNTPLPPQITIQPRRKVGLNPPDDLQPALVQWGYNGQYVGAVRSNGILNSFPTYADYLNFQYVEYGTILAEKTIPLVKDGTPGSKGVKGEKGDPGTSVNSVDVEYAYSDSPVTAPETGWATEAPLWEDGKYLWSRTTVTYSDGTTSTTVPACVTGSRGMPGSKGDAGRGISSVVEQYYVSTSPTSLTGGAWSPNRPAWVDGKYIWTRSVITYTDNTTHITEPICVTGFKGATGQKGDTGEAGAKGDKGETGAKGDAGSRGPTLRGPQEWSSLPNGYQFYSGAEGEPFVDVVLYEGYYYYCKQSHQRSALYYPGRKGDTYWQLGDRVDLIATKILLSEYALVKNLGVETIEMKDADGNVLFEAKDGIVTCKTGTFDNVNVQSGKIAGFNIVGVDLTNEGFNTDARLISRNDARGAFAAVGANVLPTVSGFGFGARAMARFENTETGGDNATNYAAILVAQGKQKNVALHIDGGCVQGYAMSNKVVSAATTLDRTVSNVICMGSSEYTVTLPSMRRWDDGHVVRLKSLCSKAVKFKAQACETFNGNSVRTSMPVIIYDRTSYMTSGGTVSLDATSDSCELVWVRDYAVVISGTTYYGAWVQYKFPRDW